MKGGIACMALAAEVLAALGVDLRGDLIVNTVTDEESTGAGGLVTARTLQADGAIVPEPSGLDVWIACRGSLLPTITVEGRAGHAGIAPRDPDEGGAVNAIEKMAIVLEAIRRPARALGAAATSPVPLARRLRPHDHRRRRVDRLVPRRLPARVPHRVPARPGRRARRREPRRAGVRGVDRARRGRRSVAARASAADRVVVGRRAARGGRRATSRSCTAALASARAVGRPSALAGLDNWHDGATLTVEAGIPAICLGPGDIHLAHGTEESVPIADLVACAQALAVTAMRFCGT